MTPLRLAHRGDWRAAPENSLAAMRAALAVPGCDALEFDVRTSRDGVPVLLHDPTLERVQGVARAVDTLDAFELAGYLVPTLADVLAAAGREAFLDIELKAPPTPAFMDVVKAARGESGDRGLRRAVISSFDGSILARMRELRPDWTRWLNAIDLAPATIDRARDLDCAAVAVAWRSIDAPAVERAGAAGLEVVAWTVRRRPTFDRLERLGVAAICAEAAALDG